ncbi:MAG: alkaline phosphatase family protein [Betaproteobacteria bacterium]|nr:MAG: alkaline phosphatase family protein [Betaproteobacteria bacterium]
MVICDGLRRDLVTAELCPEITRLRARGRSFERHRSVFPSVTRSASASIATGCHPARHGLHGNTMALPHGAGYAVHNVGEPSFVDTLRAATGGTLKVPTLAERLRGYGGAIVFSNVSPGGAYFQDPDGHGHVYHRAGSYAPGRAKVSSGDHLDVSHDAEGDACMTDRFCGEVLSTRRPDLAVLWLCEPDHTQHDSALGSPEHLDAVSAADRCVGQVRETVERLRHDGEDILLLVGSDHGHETITDIVPVEREIHAAGLKRALDSPDVVVAPQGTSVLVYFSADALDRVDAVADFLRARPWAGEVVSGEALAGLGMQPSGGLRIAVSMAKRTGTNLHGIPGLSATAVRFDPDPAKLGCGQHGGLGEHEQQPFLLASGGGFAAGSRCDQPTSIVDIAPTIVRHLGLHAAAGSFDGTALPLTAGV